MWHKREAEIEQQVLGCQLDIIGFSRMSGPATAATVQVTDEATVQVTDEATVEVVVTSWVPRAARVPPPEEGSVGGGRPPAPGAPQVCCCCCWKERTVVSIKFSDASKTNYHCRRKSYQ